MSEQEGMDDLITIVHQAGKIARLEAEIERLRAENKKLRHELYMAMPLREGD